MITIEYLYETKSGERREGESKLWDAGKARRLIWALRRRGCHILGVMSDDPEDMEALAWA